MEEFLDMVWLNIVVFIKYVTAFLDRILTPLNALGPAVAILTIAIITVAATKYFSKIYKTKRYLELQKEFQHWYNLRQEAQACKDPEKGRLLAKNIDQAKLNRVYYDYFFEGLLSNLLTTYIPVLLVLAYVNEAYRPVRLQNLFGRTYIFKLSQAGDQSILIGSVFWFVFSLLLVYVIWTISVKIYLKYIK